MSDFDNAKVGDVLPLMPENTICARDSRLLLGRSFGCTRPEHRVGQHVAQNSDGEVVHVWPGGRS